MQLDHDDHFQCSYGWQFKMKKRFRNEEIIELAKRTEKGRDKNKYENKFKNKNIFYQKI